jgi:hypothetical protein
VLKLEARFDLKRFPSVLVIVLALAVALFLGAAAGYSLKPSGVVVGPTQQPGSSSAADTCIFVDQHKAC